MDNDGLADIVVPAYTLPDGSPPRNGVLVLGDTRGNWRNARRIWNQWLYHVTNVDEDSGIPAVPANNWQTLNNNRTQVSIDGLGATAAPDLTVSKVTINSQNCPASVGITARVGNGGSLHVAAGQQVNFYGGDPATGGMLIGTRPTTRALYPGEFEDVTLTGVALPSSQVFVTVGDPPVETLAQSNNLARLPHTWAQASGLCLNCTFLANLTVYRGIDGMPHTLWIQNFGNTVVPSGTSPFYQVRFQFPVNATSVTIQNFASNTGFLTGTLDFSNGFSTPFTFNANGEGTISFTEQQNISWVRLTAATTRPDGPSVSEFIITGSYTDPQFRINEGTGRLSNNKAASAHSLTPCDPTVNQPPQITSAPPITAGMAVAYTYQVQVFDPNGDTPSFALLAAPAGMTVHSSSGLINWTPIDTQTGNSLVTLQVSDGRGGIAEQSFTINVASAPNANSPPRFTSTPVTSVNASEAYQYSASATDSDGDTVLFSLLQSPGGTTVDQFTGLLAWTPSISQIGLQFFTIEAQDGRGGRATQSFAVLVQPVTTPLPAQPLDGDSDGFDETEDCDDTKSDVNPGRTEIPGNSLDDDCNSATPDQLPADSVTCSIVTDKRSYDANSLAQLTVTIRDLSSNLSITGLQAHVAVSDPGGENVFNSTLPVNTLSPNAFFRATTSFGVEVRPPGTYRASVDLRFGPVTVCSSQASFAIRSSAAQGKALTGEITADPVEIKRVGSTFTYEVRNVGNVDLSTLNLQILVVELSSGTVVRTLTDQASLNRGQSFSNRQTFSSAGVKAGDHLAILQGESGGVTQTVSSTLIRVVNQSPVAKCQSVTRSANQSCQLTLTPQELDDGSLDPDGDPISLGLSPAGPYPLGTTTITLTATDDSGAASECVTTVTVVDNTPPAISCPANIVVATTTPGSCTALVNYEMPVGTDNCPNSLTTQTAGFPSGAAFPLGTTTNTFTVTDAAGNSTTCSSNVTVEKIATTSTVTVIPASQPYSDQVALEAMLAADSCAAGVPAANVTFYVGMQNMGTVPLVNIGGMLKGTLLVPLLEPSPFGTRPAGQMAPGMHTVTAVFGGVDPDFIVGSPTTTLNITKEAAEATYSGPTYFSTANLSSYTAEVTLSATVVDVDDSNRGDIRNAKVEFHKGLPTGPLLGSAMLPVGLVNPLDSTTGTATTTFNYTLTNTEFSAGGTSFDVYTVVNGYYMGQAGPDTITVSVPGTDNVSGGGFLVMQQSSGAYAGANGSKMNLGYTMKYNKSGKNLQGQANIIVRDGGKIYQIKSNAINSLAVTASSYPKTATFTTKANMKDITDPLNPIDLGGNLTLQVDMTDAGTGGQNDMIGVTLWNADGGLYFSSNWNGLKTVQQLLGGGNVSVFSSIAYLSLPSDSAGSAGLVLASLHNSGAIDCHSPAFLSRLMKAGLRACAWRSASMRI